MDILTFKIDFLILLNRQFMLRFTQFSTRPVYQFRLIRPIRSDFKYNSVKLCSKDARTAMPFQRDVTGTARSITLSVW